MHLLAGCCNVAVSAGGCHGVIDVADGGSGRIVVSMDGYGVEAIICSTDAAGGEDVVLQNQCVAVAPSLQTARVVVGAVERAGEGTAAYGKLTVKTMTYDAAEIAVAIGVDNGADGDVHEAVFDGILHAAVSAPCIADEAGTVFMAADGTADHEVADGGAHDFAEGCGIAVAAADADGQRLFVAVEGTGERMSF